MNNLKAIKVEINKLLTDFSTLPIASCLSDPLVQ